jgi:hypothetical protein
MMDGQLTILLGARASRFHASTLEAIAAELNELLSSFRLDSNI